MFEKRKTPAEQKVSKVKSERFKRWKEKHRVIIYKPIKNKKHERNKI